MKNLLISIFLMTFACSINAMQEVSVDTKDKKLLKNKDVDEMFEVAKPSTRLYLMIDGMAEEVQIKFTEGNVHLIKQRQSKLGNDVLIQAFNEATGNTHKVVVRSMDNSNEKMKKSKDK